MKKIYTEKLETAISDNKARWQEDAAFYNQNEAWLEKSALIALRVLRFLRRKNITQKELAEKISVSPQYINKVVKGRENLTLETICKIEKVLGIKLIEVPEYEDAENETFQKGFNALKHTLGEEETEKFITLISAESNNYTEWQRMLWEHKTIDQLNEEAVDYSKNKGK